MKIGEKMSKLNILTSIVGYADENPTNNASRNNFKWTTDLQGIEIKEPKSETVKLAPNQLKSLFSGVAVVSDDNTTTYDITLKPSTSNTYIILHNAGASPQFRTPRAISSDATTQVTVSKNGPLLIFTATGGTIWSLSSVVVGDEVRIGGTFNLQNQGKFKVLSKTSTSFTVDLASGVAEGPITLGMTFDSQVQIYSSAGVQIGDKLDVSSSFSSVSFGTYEITDVASNYIEIYSSRTLPEEIGVQTRLNIYTNQKKFIYIESDKKLNIKINGIISNTIEPIQFGTKQKPGMFLNTASVYSLEIENKSLDTATVFYVTAE
jgi:hypothetical protein